MWPLGKKFNVLCVLIGDPVDMNHDTVVSFFSGAVTRFDFISLQWIVD